MTPAATKLVGATIRKQGLLCRWWAVWALLKGVEFVWPYKVTINIELRGRKT